MIAPRARAPRSTFIDLSRGLAVVCMVEHHTFDAWMPEAFHGSAPDRLFRFLGGVAAPTFLFLAGLSMVLMMEGLLARGATRREAAAAAASRGGMILLGAYLFRFQEWALAFGASLFHSRALASALAAAPPSTMLRIDVLNCIGVSLLLVALFWSIGRSALARAALLAGVCAAVVLAAPLVLAADLSRWPQVLGDYLNGTSPRALFPLFPWLGFALGGAAVGHWLAKARSSPEPGATLTMLSRLSLLCVAVWVVTREVDALPFSLYARLEWWRSSPAYFLLRCCTLVWALWACAVLERGFQPVRARLGWVRPGPLVQLGQHSLVIYWVHIEIVYGSLTWPWRGKMSLGQASLGLALLFAAMLALSYLVEPAAAWAGSRGRRLLGSREGAALGS